MDKKLKQLKETWELLNEWFKVHEYSSGTVIGKGTYGFEINGVNYVAAVDDFRWKDYIGLDVSFGVIREEVSDRKRYWVDYSSTINEVDATDVVATVVDIAVNVAQDEMPKDEPWLLSFNPTKEESSQEGVETKRSSLYKRVANRLANKYGWEMVDTIRMDVDSVAFVMQSIRNKNVRY